MNKIFIEILNMSISAGWIVLAVLILRILLNKAPKWIFVVMWGIVGARLVCPFSFESALSLIPSATTVSPEIMLDKSPHINSGIPVINNFVNPIISESFAPQPIASANPLQILIPIFSFIWITGIISMLIYAFVSFVVIKFKVRTAIKLYDIVFQSEYVKSPFVLGLFKPKIYLPFNINDSTLEFVVAHENAHIKRRDYLWKPLGFMILSIYWFNPIIWLCYILLCRDIELACDEKVVKEFNNEQKADYSQALLDCSVNRRMIAACPLAFGETGVKSRIKSVLNYKRPAFWVIVLSIFLSICIAVCFLTNPKSNRLVNIENSNYNFIPEETSAILFSSDGETYNSLGKEVSIDMLKQLLNLKISHKEVSLSRAEDRDKTNTLVFQTDYDAAPTQYSYIKGIKIHFNTDFTEVWVYDDVKPTFSYRVIEPQKARNIYNNIVNYSKFSFAQNVETHTDFEHVYFTLESVSYDNDNNPVLNVVWKNDSNIEVTIGEIYSVEYMEYGEWLDTYFEERIFNLLGFQLKPNGEIRKSYSLKGYDLSKNGKYRILAPFSVYNSKEQYHIWIEFDVKNAAVGVADSSNVNITKDLTAISLESLKSNYPMYFDLDTTEGLKVYIWQMSENSYYCGLLPGKNKEHTDKELWELYNNSTTLEEMKAIVLSYITPASKDIVSVCPVQNPLSSYWHNIDENYINEINTLFWLNFPFYTPNIYSPIISNISYDVDNDGVIESCQLHYGPTSGLFTFTFSIFENGTLEYFNIFNSPDLRLSFEVIEDNVYLIGENDTGKRTMSFYIEDGNIVIQSDEQDISYWGKQGINSEYVSLVQ